MQSATGTVKVGDRVRVKVNHRGAVQEGTVVEVGVGGFVWVNACNFRRTSPWCMLTTKPVAADKPPRLIAEWMADEAE